MSIRHITASLRAVAIASAFALLAHGQASAQDESLYKRIGGYDVIAAIATDFTKGLGGDPVLRPYFFARSADSRRRILQMFRELLCADAGGPCFYVGRDMKTAHVGLKMGETEWTALMKLWGEILDRHKLEGRNKDGMVEIFAKYKGDILGAASAK
ncbi:MAG: group 1 truncated hemoglobin [Hyphomicrobiaceae bacterium]